jgi:quinol monooxygenase YgiN
MTQPPVPPGPIITLVYRVAPEKRAALLEFLQRNFPFYERPGGIRMALYESVDDPQQILELVAYADEASYARDQERVEKDPEMRTALAQWRAYVDGAVEVRRLKPLAFPGSVAQR